MDHDNTQRLITCHTCKNSYPITEEHWHSVLIKRFNKKPSVTTGRCKKCGNEYTRLYQSKLKEQGLTRKKKIPIEQTLINRGVLYIIGSTPKNPVKIGITRGTTSEKRMTALQTSHWLDLKIIYQTPVVSNIELLERELHKRFSKERVKGEWFRLSPKKIQFLVSELQEKFLENRNPVGSPRK